MTTRRQANRIFWEMFPEQLRRARMTKRREWFQSLTPGQRLNLLWRCQGEILKRYGDFPPPLPIHKRFPGLDPSKIQVLSLPREQRRKALAELILRLKSE